MPTTVGELDRSSDASISDLPRSEVVSLIPALRAFARTFHRDVNDADDLVQETLTKAIGNIHQFQPGTAMKSWLFTIMRNSFYTKIRKSSREAPALADDAASRPAVLATQEWSARGHEIREALARLPEQQREVIMLIGVLGVSYEEAAEICGCAMGTIKSRLNRARARLLDEMGETDARASVEADSHLPSTSATKAPSYG
ncbi:sigma-70 family RNA polymerase sigma factor [Aliihoeflea sp. 40Bstr573]|uniref:sigma-70 family RNA polymerase sigma factor n=1 Tax=Aliihoeflea sp. 40Bstr573 TaxID=2696467 RepID=UPI002094D6A1|nr:sigma-70 family RNA polymerase sigma factor [Aliihoeflea sp. 40Bstr573]MCO6386788.1 sigma-70 family RNA polymerase sigma factor [Aliihoeflea sp. 40Bstr573]